MVVIEMLNALNAISEDASLFEMSPFVNPYLLAAIANSIVLHCVILYIPFMNEIFSIMPLSWPEWQLVLIFSGPVLLIEEVLKVVGRAKVRAELEQRMADKKN